MASNFLRPSRHGTVYYYRRRVPNDLKQLIGKRYLTKSLETAHLGTAITLARAYAAKTDALYQHLRTMKKSSTPENHFGYTFKVDLDAWGKPSSITVDAEPEEQEAVNSAIRTVLESTGGRSTPAETVGLLPKSFEGAISEYMEKATGKAQTKATYRSKFAHAQEFFGGRDADVLKIDQADLVRYATHVVDTVEHVTTQIHYIAIVTAFLNWHRVRVSGLGALTTKTLLPKRESPESEERDAYTHQELKHLIENAIKYRSSSPSKFWVTVAPIFMGCRLEELCQVHLRTDLVHDEATGIWYLSLDGKPDPDGIVRKSMKKPSSWRRVPIHTSLVNHGFVDFLLSQAKKGFDRPFQDEWQPREVESDVGQILKWSHYISRWGGRELKAVAKTYGFDAGRDLAYFHSMRHTFKVTLGDAGVSSEISEAIAGRRYGGADAERYEKLKQNHRRLSEEGIEPGLNELVKLLESALSI